MAWLDKESIEPQALEQLYNISEMPFVFKHLAVMPDCHLGKGATVGSVIATNNAIIPAAVGVDIGCGMIAVLTKFTAHDLPEDIDNLRHSIERRIPLGAGRFNTSLTKTAEKRVHELKDKSEVDYSEFTKKWELQIGTLGSGNHFIEICLDEQDRVWAVLHSGSRGVGNLIAQKHIKIAQKLMEQFFIMLKDKDLAYFVQGTKEFNEYMRDLHWAQDFARLNREEMMDRVMTDLSYAFYGEDGHQSEIEKDRINCHHNFTQIENHFGHNVWVTRKGAIEMKNGQRGVIPGSMGTRSYIVSGLANPLSFNSAPHGAGRRLSRTKAKEQYTVEDLEKATQGISCRKDKEVLDEIPLAYKDIDEVIENSKDLVHVDHELRQILNIKGN